MMKKLILKIIKLMPEKLRLSIYRSQAQVPPLAQDSNFSIEIARTREDLQEAYKLLHDCYVGTKLMTTDPSGLRCNIFSFLPHSTVIIAKYKSEIIGTVSLIRDSCWGLPSDKDYLKENNFLRGTNGKLVEVSALAVSQSFRNQSNAVSLLLMKYLYNYTHKFLDSDHLICTVHPRAEDFYKALWHFRRNGKMIRYPFVQGALAVHLSMKISSETQKNIIASYSSSDENKNLALFVLNEDRRFHYPHRQSGPKIDPVLTPELFEYFCILKTKIWQTFSSVEKQGLLRIYTGLFKYQNSSLEMGSEKTTQISRDYRIPIETQGILSYGNQYRMVKLLDISAEGAFIAWSPSFPIPQENVLLVFKIADRTFRLNSQIMWKNNNAKSRLQPYGFGLKFLDSKKIDAHLLQSWLYNDPLELQLPEQDMTLQLQKNN